MRRPNEERIAGTLCYIEKYEEEHGCIPSFRTIMKARKYKSMNTLVADINRLKERNAILVDADQVFTSPKGERIKRRTATVVGGVRCGCPTDATEEAPETVELPVKLFGEALNRVIMKAEGDSMTGLGIYDGDWLVVIRQPTANEGDVIVAMLDGGEYTCKTLRKDDKGYYLEAANAAYDPIRPSSSWYTYGVVQQVIHNV